MITGGKKPKNTKSSFLYDYSSGPTEKTRKTLVKEKTKSRSEGVAKLRTGTLDLSKKNQTISAAFYKSGLHGRRANRQSLKT